MKKLILIASLLLSLNGWAEDEKEEEFRITFGGKELVFPEDGIPTKWNLCNDKNPKDPCRDRKSVV